MGLFDKVKEFAGNNPDKVNQGIEKVGDEFDKRTDGKYSQHTDTAQQKAGEYLGGGEGAPAEGEQPPAEGEQPPA